MALTHWPSLARVIRGEVMQLKESEYIQIAAKLGQSRLQIAWRHMVPHLFPQFVVGLILMFPHAILHEASITFLGFGLSSEQPAIGIILSESMRYLITGKWWLAMLPGLMLVPAQDSRSFQRTGIRQQLHNGSAGRRMYCAERRKMIPGLPSD